MTGHRVVITRAGDNDVTSIFNWIEERSPKGAAAWLQSWRAAIESVAQDPSRFAESPETMGSQLLYRYSLFKTRRGRWYRMVFRHDAATVWVLRVIGPGQLWIPSEDSRGEPES